MIGSGKAIFPSVVVVVLTGVEDPGVVGKVVDSGSTEFTTGSGVDAMGASVVENTRESVVITISVVDGGDGGGADDVATSIVEGFPEGKAIELVVGNETVGSTGGGSSNLGWYSGSSECGELAKTMRSLSGWIGLKL